MFAITSTFVFASTALTAACSVSENAGCWHNHSDLAGMNETSLRDTAFCLP